MYITLLFLHSWVRWILLIALIYSILRSILGVWNNSKFTKLDNISRSVVSGISHIQLLIGFVLYFKSPLVMMFRQNPKEGMQSIDLTFFGIIHISLMLLAVILLTIGAAKAKRAEGDHAKHLQILTWFGIAILLMCLALPWAFSPYVARPHFRFF